MTNAIFDPVGGPEPALKLLAGHKLAGASGKDDQYLDGLPR
jgi:hypothetical protein